MKITKKQNIGAHGEKLVEAAFLSVGWTPRKDDLDAGIDISVEVPAISGAPSFRVLVQVKTATRYPKRSDGGWLVSVRKPVLRAYEESRHPVLLFAVELESKRIRWIDLLCGSKDNPSKASFLLQEKDIFIEEDVSNLYSKLTLALAERDSKYASPIEILKNRSECMESLDNRFKVVGSVINGREVYELTPKQPISIEMDLHVSRQSDANAIQDALKVGKPIKLDHATLDTKESGLLSYIGRKAGTVELLPVLEPVRIRLFDPACASDPPELHEPNLDIDGTATRGFEGGTFNLKTKELPLSAVVTFSSSDGLLVELSFDFSEWVGLPLTRLPYLKRLTALMGALAKSKRIGLARFVAGDYAWASAFTLPLESESFFERSITKLNAISDLAYICKSVSAEPIWSGEPVSAEEIKNLTSIASIIRNGRGNLPGVSFHFLNQNGSADFVRGALKNEKAHFVAEIEITWDEVVVVTVPLELHVKGYRVVDLPDDKYRVEPINSDSVVDASLFRG